MWKNSFPTNCFYNNNDSFSLICVSWRQAISNFCCLINENNAMFFNPLVFKEATRILSTANHMYTVSLSSIRHWSHASLVVRGRKHSSLPCKKNKKQHRHRGERRVGESGQLIPPRHKTLLLPLTLCRFAYPALSVVTVCRLVAVESTQLSVGVSVTLTVRCHVWRSA